MRWFKHMTASADDEKLSMLMDAHGLEGYGFWWRVVEIIAKNVSEKGGTSVSYSAQKWARIVGIRSDKFRRIAEECASLRLFQLNSHDNYIEIDIPNILKFRDEYTRKSGQTPDKIRRKKQIQNTDTEKEEEINTPPHPPQGGELISENSADSLSGKKSKPKHQPTGNSLPELEAAIAAYTDDPPLREALRSFRAMRERIRKPLTGDALKLVFRELDKHAGDDAGLKTAMLEQSVLHSWQGIFPLKTEQARASPGGNARQRKSWHEEQDERNMREARRLCGVG